MSDQRSKRREKVRIDRSKDLRRRGKKREHFEVEKKKEARMTILPTSSTGSDISLNT